MSLIIFKHSSNDLKTTDGQTVSQLSNLRWMPHSFRIDFGPAMKIGSSRRFKRYPTTYMWVSSWLPFTMDWGLSWFILIHSKGMLTWNSHIGCWVSLESSWWAHFNGRAKTYADWIWYLSKIGELWPLISPLHIADRKKDSILGWISVVYKEFKELNPWYTFWKEMFHVTRDKLLE